MGANRGRTVVPLPHEPSAVLNGKQVVPGDEFTIKGEGRFSFRNLYLPDQSITCYGPVGSKRAMIRSFKRDQITTIHTKTKARES